ncbi:MAG: hypothetical protein R6T78_01735 [Dehalococcoidales bacterium]
MVSSLSSCDGAGIRQDYDATQSALESAQAEIVEIREEMTKLQSDYNDLYEDYADIEKDYQSLLGSYQDLSERSGQMGVTGIGWAELKTFLEQDNTDRSKYVEGIFDCSGFAITLRDNATSYGIRCAYVEVEFLVGQGHALNAFETTDHGTVYVDSTEADHIAFVEIGKQYGVIGLDSIKTRFIECSGSPDRFWGDLEYTTCSDPFNYSYYSGYQARVKFYRDTIDSYNKAVEGYNSGSHQWSYQQLSNWMENIESLAEDLGSAFYQTGDEVNNIESYWNG